MIKFVDMFSGIGGFREGLTRAGGFTCVGHCEIDKYANRSYNALFDTKGEWFVEDARKADPETMPDFQLLCGGFPCQAFSTAGSRKGFGDPRGTLFFELARLAEARKPPYLLFENVPGLLSHDGGRTFATILNTLDRLGYGVEWQCLNSKDFGVPQSRNRVYIVGYLDERCRGKVFPFTETAGSSLIQTHGGHQGERVYSPEGLSCTLAANPGGFGGKTGLYEVGVPIKCATKTGYQMAQVGDSIDLSYATVNSRRGRVGKEIAHTVEHIAETLERLRSSLIMLQYRLLVNNKQVDTWKRQVNYYRPILQDYHAVTQQLADKKSEQEQLQTTRNTASLLQIAQRRQLAEQIAALTEKIEELRSRQAMILHNLDCKNNGEAQRFGSYLDKLEEMQEKLAAQRESLTQQLSATIKQYLEIENMIQPEDEDSVRQRRTALRPDVAFEREQQLSHNGYIDNISIQIAQQIVDVQIVGDKISEKVQTSMAQHKEVPDR